MPLIVLARHGNTFEDGQSPRYIGSRTDLPLTKKGREQALCIAKELKRRGIVPDVFYAGSLLRQIETSGIVCEEFGISQDKIEIEPALQEIDLGLWEGLTKEEIEKKWSVELSEWENQFIWPEKIFGHSLQSREKSLKEFISKLAISAIQSNKVVFLTTSNGILRLVYSLYATDFSDLRIKKNLKQIKVGTGALCLANMSNENPHLNLLEWNVQILTDVTYK